MKPKNFGDFCKSVSGNAILFSFLLFLLPRFGYSINQQGNTPEAWHYQKVEESGAGNYKGDLTLNLPLLTIPGRNGLDYKISLGYKSGITSTQNATWVGLGWNLDIGSVYRQVKFGVDDGEWDNCHPNYANDDENGILTKQSNSAWRFPPSILGTITDGYDSPDVYNATFPGGSVKLQLFENNNDFYFGTTTFQGMKVEYNYNKDDNQGCGVQSFTLTTKEGVRYVYEHRRIVAISDAINLPDRFDTSGNDPYHFRFVYSWDLTKILSADYVDNNPVGCDANDYGSWIKINYSSNYDLIYSSMTFVYFPEWIIPSPPLQKYYDLLGQSSEFKYQKNNISYVQSIETPTHKAIFSISDRLDNPAVYWNTGDWKCKKLDSITLQTSNGDNISKIIFSYNYSLKKQRFAEPEWELDAPWNGVYHWRADSTNLTLTSIQEQYWDGAQWKSIPKTKIHYDPVNPMIDFGSDCVVNGNLDDYWKYYNGTVNDEEYPQAWSLTEIIYPTGGTVKYIYEPNKFNRIKVSNIWEGYSETYWLAPDQISGGCRIKYIITDDKNGCIDTTLYEYPDASNTQPEHIVFAQPFKIREINSNHSINAHPDAGVQYPWIKKINPDGSYSITKYTTIGNNYVNDATVATGYDPEYLGGFNPEIEHPSSFEPWLWHSNCDFERLYMNPSYTWGYPLEIIKYSSTNSLIETVLNYYSIVITDSMDGIWSNSFNTTQGGWLALDSVKVTTDGVTRTTRFEQNPTNGLVKKMTEVGDHGNRITYTGYAFEYNSPDYSEMVNKHMLSQKALTVIGHENVPGQSNSTFSLNIAANQNVDAFSFTHWNDGLSADGTQWQPDDILFWNDKNEDGNYDTGEGFYSNDFIKYDAYGNLLEFKDANGITNTNIWGNTGTQLIAKGVNGNREEFGFTGFECSDGNGWNREEQIITYGDARSGVKVARVYTANGTQYGPTQDFSQSQGLIADTGFKASIWIKGPATAYLYICINNSQPSDIAYSTNSGDWELLEVELTKSQILTSMNGDDFIRVFVGNNNSTPAYFDDLRFFPSDGMLTTVTYDSATGNVFSSSNENNIPTLYRYDQLGRLSETVNAEKAIIAYDSSYYSRDENSDQFNAQYPNFTKSMRILAQQFVEEFAYDDTLTNHNWSIYTGSGTIPLKYDPVLKSQVLETNTSLVPETGLGIKYPASGTIDQASRHLWLKLKTDYDFHIYVRILASNQNEYYIRYDAASGSPSFNYGYYVLYHLGSTFKNGDWHVIERELEKDFQSVTETENLTIENVRWFCFRGEFWIEDLRLTDEPVTTITYSDGLGREIQTQKWFGESDIASKITYNETGNQEKLYKPQLLSNSEHTFLTSVSGTYEKMEYYWDPLARLKKQIHRDGTTWIAYSYGADDSLDNQTTYRFEQILDEENKITKNYFDKFNNKTGSRIAIGTNDEIKLITEYDIIGNPVTIKPPNYHTPPSGTANDWKSEMVYNTLSQVVEKITPDDHTTKYIYDQNGNLRYSQNALQAQIYYFTVYKYDALNRVILTGEEKDKTYNWTTSYPPLDSLNFGTQIDEWKIKYSYDENYVTGATNYSLGQLTKVEINEDADGTPEHTTTYVYDKFGYLTEKRTGIEGLSEKTIRHLYDLQGNEIELEYPSGNTVVRQYDQLGRLKKVLTVE